MESNEVVSKLKLEEIEVDLYEIPAENLKLLCGNVQVLVADFLVRRFSVKKAKKFKIGYDRFCHYFLFEIPKLSEVHECSPNKN